jgi:hypothetical protein
VLWLGGIHIEEVLAYANIALKFNLSSEEMEALIPDYLEHVGAVVGKSCDFDGESFDAWYDGEKFIVTTMSQSYKGPFLFQALENAANEEK